MPELKIAKFRGLNNVQDPAEAGKGDLQVATNVDVNDVGGLKMRLGSMRLYSGAPHSLMSDGTDLLFREGTDLKRFDPTDQTTEVLQTGFTEDLELAHVHLNHSLYFSDGVTSGVYQDRRARSLGLAVPSAVGLARIAGTLLAGRYHVHVTYVRADGQESGASTAAWLDLVSAGGLRVTLAPSSDADVSSINVYVSTPHGERVYLQATAPNQAGAVDVTDRWSLGRGRSCRTIHMGPMPAGTLLEFYRGRLYMANGPLLWVSELFKYELCSFDHGLLMFPGDITMLTALENGIWLGTTRGTQFLYGRDIHQQGGFDVRGRLDSYPPLRTAVRTDGENMPEWLRLASGQVAVWPTSEGIMIGDREGTVKNFTGDRWVAPDGAAGTGFINDLPGSAQYLFGILGTPGQGSGNVRVTINQ